MWRHNNTNKRGSFVHCLSCISSNEEVFLQDLASELLDNLDEMHNWCKQHDIVLAVWIVLDPPIHLGVYLQTVEAYVWCHMTLVLMWRASGLFMSELNAIDSLGSWQTIKWREIKNILPGKDLKQKMEYLSYSWSLGD